MLRPQIDKLPWRNAQRRTSVQQLRDACRDLVSLQIVREDETGSIPQLLQGRLASEWQGHGPA